VLFDPGRFSGAVAITRAYSCLPGAGPGRHLLDFGYEAGLLHLRYGLLIALSTLRHVRYLPQRKTRFPLAGWALSGREFHPLDVCGFVSAHPAFKTGLANFSAPGSSICWPLSRVPTFRLDSSPVGAQGFVKRSPYSYTGLRPCS
jgi:hypothetical protein